MNGFKDECGVMGVLGDDEASRLVYLGLYALQHRGQEACGIVTVDDDKQGKVLRSHKQFGLVSDGFNKDILSRLTGRLGVGHVRYSTTGGNLVQNIQPIVYQSSENGSIVLAHNGNLTNAESIRKDLEASGSIFTSTSDTEVISHLIAKSKKLTVKEKLISALQQVKGGYSLVVAAEDTLYAVRDPYGLRPLVLGKKGITWIVASESCALDLIDARLVREIKPGEFLILNEGQEEASEFPFEKKPEAFCSFEPIYFSRPDSTQNGSAVYVQRKRMGEILAKEYPTEADVVVAIPDSGVPMAIGYSQATGIPLELGLIRNHYVGRTFIEPSQAIRDFGVKLKLNAIEGVLKGKRVVVIDDSIVRGTTSTKIVRMLREAGAKEIHFRVGSPPITHSCFYGVDTPDRKKLLAAQITVDKIRDLLGADSLGYLSKAGLKEALSDKSQGYCTACFTGSYPEDICAPISKQPTDTDGPGYFASK
ncbi:MAG: amidophosphoribosyltransferase [Pseudomonadota bacterium]